MGIVQSVRGRSSITAAAADYVAPANLPIASPWASRQLAEVVFNDIVGKNVPRPVNRNAAMRLSPVSRGRNSLVAAISRFPLVELDGSVRAASQSSWLQGTGGSTHPALRITWTVDDLVFYGWSLWSRLTFDRIDKSRWNFDADGRVLVDGRIAQDDEVFLIPGLHEGILAYGDESIRDARDLYAIVRARLKNPAPNLLLKQTAGKALTDDEIDALIARWATARAGENGGVGYVSEGIDVAEMGADGDSQLLIEARNAAAVDLARHIGLSASRVDATTPKASLNYETREGTNLEFLDLDLALYMTPITARLSMDDIVAPGRRVEFDISDYTSPAKNPTGPVRED